MIDIGELQKQGKIRPPQETQTEIPTNKDGFIEINTQTKEKKSEVNFLDLWMKKIPIIKQIQNIILKEK